MFKLNLFLILLFLLFIQSCNTDETTPPTRKPTVNQNITTKIDTTLVDTIVIVKPPSQTCKWETYLENEGLVDIQTLDSSILVELKYSTEDNFMQKDMYGCLDKCFLQPDVAQKLIKAQKTLKDINPKLSLLVYDGLRPRSIQQYMWDILDMPLHEKVKFVSNPKRGSLHNFGAAVDITIYNLDSKCPLDMGAPYDYIGVKAWPTKEKLMLEEGIITQKHIDNRKLLRKVMTKAKFFNIQTEWWHFNSCYRKKAYEIYQIVEGFPIEDNTHL